MCGLPSTFSHGSESGRGSIASMHSFSIKATPAYIGTVRSVVLGLREHEVPTELRRLPPDANDHLLEVDIFFGEPEEVTLP